MKARFLEWRLHPLTEIELEKLPTFGVPFRLGEWEYLVESMRLGEELVIEVKRAEGVVPVEPSQSEKERILRWLRVAFQWNAPFQSVADAIERGDYDKPYSEPPGLVNDEPSMTGEEYDARRERCSGCGVSRAERYSRGKCPGGCFSVSVRVPSNLIQSMDLEIVRRYVRDVARHLTVDQLQELAGEAAVAWREKRTGR